MTERALRGDDVFHMTLATTTGAASAVEAPITLDQVAAYVLAKLKASEPGPVEAAPAAPGGLIMRKIPAMVDMRNTPAELSDLRDPVPQAPTYPYGLCIRLQTAELDKLGLSDAGVDIGDMLHLHCMARVTSISKHDNASGDSNCCVELQITDMVGEDEAGEDDAAEPAMSATQRRSKLYGG